MFKESPGTGCFLYGIIYLYMPAPKGNKHALGNKGGRPTKYRKEYCDLVVEYLNDPNECGETWEEFHKTRGTTSDSFERHLVVHIPSIQNFSLWSGIPLRTIPDWEKANVEFSQAIDKIRRTQHKMLIDGTNSGRYPSSTANLILTTNHGYTTRTEGKVETTEKVSIDEETINKLKDVFSKD